MSRLICFIESLLVLIIMNAFSGEGNIQKIEKTYRWQEIDEWSSCSKTCGLGTQQKMVICLEKAVYLEKLVHDSKCNNETSAKISVRECNVGDCQSRYLWRPGKWSDCSQTCGNSGRKTRDVECVYNEGPGNLILSDEKYCDQNFRPYSVSRCNILDCPLNFILGEWGKCVQSRECSPGSQRRSMTCVSILASGERKPMPRHACSMKQKPPISWRKCFDNMNTKECLNNIRNNPVIATKENTLVQMRKTKILQLEVGQLAYVLLYTKISINCPVNYFVPRDIVWKHGTKIIKYNGKSKERVKVDKKGRLRIKRLEINDQGVWTCIAGQRNASAIMKVRNPSIGFQDWMLRTALWNKEMLNEDPNSDIGKNEIIQWIKKAWSPCSVTCGGKGIQSRDVHCEKLETRHYIILADEVCENRGQKKPENRRSCQMAKHCPMWLMINDNPKQCTDKCIRIGYGQIQGNLQCIHQQKNMEFSACNRKEMPSIECKNEKCQVDWKISDWSKCSKSCGGQGIMARYLICIWKHSNETAGSLCYSQNLPIPNVIKACVAPKCNLKCVDLSPNCKARRRHCRSSIYRYSCCKTCSNIDAQSKMQANYSPDNNKVSRKVIKHKKSVNKLTEARNVDSARKRKININNLKMYDRKKKMTKNKFVVSKKVRKLIKSTKAGGNKNVTDIQQFKQMKSLIINGEKSGMKNITSEDKAASVA